MLPFINKKKIKQNFTNNSKEANQTELNDQKIISEKDNSREIILKNNSYVDLTKTILNFLFGENHPIAVSELIVELKNKKQTVYIFIVPSNEWLARVIGKEGKVINLIENLIKIKGYLNHCQAIIKIEK